MYETRHGRVRGYTCLYLLQLPQKPLELYSDPVLSIDTDEHTVLHHISFGTKIGAEDMYVFFQCFVAALQLYCYIIWELSHT